MPISVRRAENLETLRGKLEGYHPTLEYIHLSDTKAEIICRCFLSQTYEYASRLTMKYTIGEGQQMPLPEHWTEGHIESLQLSVQKNFLTFLKTQDRLQ